MNFEFSQEQTAIRDQARKFLTEQCPTRTVRQILASGQAIHHDLWRQMIDLGWTALTIPETHGGLGLGYLELCVIAEELGRSLAPVPFSSSVYLATEAIRLWGSPAQQQEYLPKLASGTIIGTLATTEGLGALQVDAQVTAGELTGSKLPVVDGDAADFAVVLANDTEQAGNLYLVDLHHRGVERSTLATMDPTRNHAHIQFSRVPAALLGSAGAGQQQLTELLDRAAVLFAFEQVGGAQAAMDMGMAYTRERYAFGRPVASFQAIKHKFADMYVALELARSNAYYGAWALSCDAPDLPLAAATARVSASDAYYQISRENIQVHGGMGFTWDFDCHLYYRRSQMLASVIGSPLQWREAVASRLLSADRGDTHGL